MPALPKRAFTWMRKRKMILGRFIAGVQSRDRQCPEHLRGLLLSLGVCSSSWSQRWTIVHSLSERFKGKQHEKSDRKIRKKLLQQWLALRDERANSDLVGLPVRPGTRKSGIFGALNL
jgi:hypothetical protein